MASDLDLRLHFGFFNAMLDDNHHPDRVYNAEDMSKFFDGLITEGVYQHVGGMFHTSPSSDGTKISIASGRAWKNHIYVYTDQTIEEPIKAANSVYDRYDALCFRFSQATRRVTLEWISGPISVGGVAQKPTFAGQAEIMPLCMVLRHSGKLTVDSGDIEYLVGVNNNTPFVKNVLGELNYTLYYTNWDNAFHNWFTNVQTLWATFKTTAENYWNNFKTTTENDWKNWLTNSNSTVKTQWGAWLTNNDSTVKTDWKNWLTNSNSTVKTDWNNWLVNSNSTVKTQWGAWLTNDNSTVKTQWNNWFGTSDSTGIKKTFWDWFGTSDSAGIKKTFWDWFGTSNSAGIRKSFWDWFGTSDSAGVRKDYLSWKSVKNNEINEAIENYHVTVEQTFWDWFGESDSAGIRKTFYNWFGTGDSASGSIRKAFYDWFGTSDTASGSVKKAWKDWFEAARDAYGEVAHFETNLYFGNNNTNKQNDSTSYPSTSGDPSTVYLKVFDSNNCRQRIPIKADGLLYLKGDGLGICMRGTGLEDVTVESKGTYGVMNFVGIKMGKASPIIRSVYFKGGKGIGISTSTSYSTGDETYSITINGPFTYFKTTKSLSTSGTTTVTLSNSEVLATSIVDVYTDIYGLNPTSVSVSNGTCTVVFPKQSSAVSANIVIAVCNPGFTTF